MKRLLGTIVTGICLMLSNQVIAATQYEAENGTLSGGAARNTNHSGYAGSGFVDGFYNRAAAQVLFNVSAPAAGSATVTLRYSAGNGTSTNTGLYVNGTKIKNITCNTTGNWDTWANQVETVTLNSGNNTIAYKSETSSGSCINLDYISVETATATYTVAYNGNGNTGGSAPATASYTQGATVSVAGVGTLTRTGYTFTGWNTSSSGTGTSYAAGSTFAMGTANVTLYASWTASATYTVAYNGNGNTGGTAPTATNYLQGAIVTVASAGTLTRTGYSFAGWNTSSSGTGTSYAAGSTFTMGTANVTLYALWTASAMYTVTYSGNGNTGGTVPVATSYLQGTTVTVASAGTLTRTGYTFSGWNTSSSGTGTSYAAGSTFTMGTSNVTLYALWTAIPTYTVTYNGNGNTGGTAPAATNYLQGATVTVAGAGTLTRTGYTFTGWNTSSSGTGTSYAAGSTFTIGAANVTLYASWGTTPGGISAVTYTEMSTPVTVTAANTVVLSLPFTAPSAGYITVTVTGLYGSKQAYTDEQKGLESFITLNSTIGGALSGFADKPNRPNGALYVNETAGFQVVAGSNTIRFIVTPRATLSSTLYTFAKCKMTVVFSPQKM